jgi:hypothetical protein
MRRRSVSLNECTTIRDELRERVDPAARTTSARRRRSLHRGALRFIRDVCADTRVFKRVLLVGLSIAELDPMVAKGAIEGLFEELKDLYASCSRTSARSSLIVGPSGSTSAGGSVLNPRSPAHRGGLARGARSGANVRPGRACLAQAADGVDDRFVQDLAQLEQLPQLTRISISDAVAAVRQESREHAQVSGRFNVPPTATGGHRKDCKPTLQPMQYLWWAEFQQRGALHYHAIIVDAPFATEGEARRWFTDHWRRQLPELEHRTQPDVQFRSASWFRKSAGDYVLKDVRKLGGKHYQQDYSRMPPSWRTFRSHQLTFAASEHREHETKAWTVCVAAADAPWHERVAQIYVERVDWHVPAVGGCRLFRRKVRGRARAQIGRVGGGRPGRGEHVVSGRVQSLDVQPPFVRPQIVAETDALSIVVTLEQAGGRLPPSCPQVSTTQPVLTAFPETATGATEPMFGVAWTAPPRRNRAVRSQARRRVDP